MGVASSIVASVQGRMAESLPAYRVEVQPSADDPFCLCVRVYGVPEGQVPAVEEQVFSAEETLPAGTPYILVPMVKSLEVTRKYCPHHLPSPPHAMPDPPVAANRSRSS
jgi:hypothetical protein